MQFLLDANRWLQIVRKRPYAAEVAKFLADVHADRVFITDLAVHSVAIVMGRFKMLSSVPIFFDTCGFGRTIRILSVEISFYPQVVQPPRPTAWTSTMLTNTSWQRSIISIVSFDADFDRTPRARLTPAAALVQLASQPHP